MTTEYNVTDSWQEIAVQPSLVEMLEGLNIWLCVSSTIPEPDSGRHFLLTVGNPRYSYSGSEKLYARRAPNSAGVRSSVSVTEAGTGSAVELNQGESFSLPAGTVGNGFFQISDNSAWFNLVWGNSGSFDIVTSSWNVSIAEQPGVLFLHEEENAVTIKNCFDALVTVDYYITYK